MNKTEALNDFLSALQQVALPESSQSFLAASLIIISTPNDEYVYVKSDTSLLRN